MSVGFVVWYCVIALGVVTVALVGILLTLARIVAVLSYYQDDDGGGEPREKPDEELKAERPKYLRVVGK